MINFCRIMLNRCTPTVLWHPGWQVFGMFIFFLALPCSAQTLSTEGPYTVVRSGTNQPLLSFSFSFDVPPTNSDPILTFDFGFSSDEPENPQTFYDSFSATLQQTNQSATALLFTSDRTGTQWAPANSGGLSINSGALTYQPITFPALSPSNAVQFAYMVSFVLPPELADGLVTVFFDFFNTMSSLSALAFVSNVQVVTNSVAPISLGLQSSAAVTGPFADESGVVIDTANKLMMLPLGSAARFFRLRSDLAALITRFQLQDQRLVFDYAFEPSSFMLQSSTNLAGPFVDEPSAVLDVPSQTVTLPVVGQARFFRIRSNPRATITGEEYSGGQLIIHFEFQPQFLTLQSSAMVVGPYADEGSVTIDPLSHQLSISRYGAARFYRLRSDPQTRISSLKISDQTVIIGYE